MLTDFYKLVKGTHTTKNCPVCNHNMSRNLRIIAHDAIVSNTAIMRDMTIGLDKTVATNCCFFPVLCSAINRYKFTNGSIVTNKYVGIFTLEFQILWNGSNDRTWKNPAVLTNPRP